MEVKEALDRYIDWYLKKRYDDHTAKALEEWKAAILNQCYANWKRDTCKSQVSAKTTFGKALIDAQQHLVFMNDDRAPHNVVIVCKYWYVQKLKAQLADTSVYEPVTSESKTISCAVMLNGTKHGILVITLSPAVHVWGLQARQESLSLDSRHGQREGRSCDSTPKE